MTGRLDVHAWEALRARSQAEIDARRLPSCQYAVAVDGEILAHETLGDAPPGSRYRIFSASKPLLPTVVWQLIDEGALAASDRVADHWPGFARHGKGEVTLEQVMSFSAGFPWGEIGPNLVADREARVAAMEEWELLHPPGERYEYHPLSAHWVLAELLERLCGDDFRRVLRARVLDPLGLHRLELGVPRPRQHDVLALRATGPIPTRADTARALGVREEDLPAVMGMDLRLFNDPEVLELGPPGGGAVSDAADLARLYQELVHNTRGLWSPEVLRDATSHVRNDLPSADGSSVANRTLGLELAGEGPFAAGRVGFGQVTPETFGHHGACGQIAWADPVSGVSFAWLTDGWDPDPVRETRRQADLCRLATRLVS